MLTREIKREVVTTYTYKELVINDKIVDYLYNKIVSSGEHYVFANDDFTDYEELTKDKIYTLLKDDLAKENRVCILLDDKNEGGPLFKVYHPFDDEKSSVVDMHCLEEFLFVDEPKKDSCGITQFVIYRANPELFDWEDKTKKIVKEDILPYGDEVCD